MPPKAKIAAPIDRPLSRAYLREFSGLSTAYPPGLSEPTSLRVMENMQVNRDGSLRIRPGLRYLSYAEAPHPGDTEALPTPDVVLSLGMKGPYTVRTGGVDTYPAGSNTVMMDGNTSTGFAVDTYLPEPEVFLNGITGVLDNGGLPPVDLTGLDFYVRWEGDAEGVAGVSLNTFGAGASASWTGAPPVQTTIGWLYPMSGGDCHVNAMNGYTSSCTITFWREDGRTTHHTYQASELYAVAVDPASLPPTAPPEPGIAYDRPFVGTHEPFYLNDGTKAYLLAVREEDLSVGFRVMVVDVNDSTMYALDDPLIDFDVRQPAEVLNFSAETTYVKYLQIDNKIFALSDNGEPMRVFKVGATKEAKALAEITRPDWQPEDKLGVIEPEADWITARTPLAVRRNRVHNPSFETNGRGWTPGPTTDKSRPQTPAVTPVAGSRVLRLASLPARTNLATQPLHAVATTGITGWGDGVGSPVLAVDGTYLKVSMPAKSGEYFAHSRLLPGVEGGTRYQVAFDYDQGAHVTMQCKVRFYGVNGAQVGDTVTHELVGSGRFSSPGMAAPKGAVNVRVVVGGVNKQDDATSVRIKNVVVCPADEGTAMFHGGSGANYFWTGAVNASASVYHPPAEVRLTSDPIIMLTKKPVVGSLYVASSGTLRNATLTLRMLNKDGELLDTATTTAAETAALARLEAGDATPPAKATRAQLRLTIPAVPRGEYHYVDAAMLETGVSVAGPYFDGATTDTPTHKHSWAKTAHDSASIEKQYAAAPGLPDPVVYTPDTLHATGGLAANPHNFAFFYTFNNEVGESAASQITLRRMSRAWTEWAWETPNAAGEPSGISTSDPEQCADQLVVYMPEDVFDEAMAEGATSWNLYMFTWSDQEPAPPVAVKVDDRELKPDSLYDECGWIRVTPSQANITDDAIIPSATNRQNYSDPSRAGQGLVAADRMILVNDPSEAGVIRWSSNQTGEYTNFTAAKGGGYKTLTSGNLYVPACVKLWQNPQSADTLTILCLGTDGQSAAFYMAPAQVTSQSDATSFMGFEETTATQGTTSPYGCEVFNNALYHPLDDQLVKSTASNYNISHKSMTDQIANVWANLATKYWIVSSQHENRLYYLVNNPAGEELEDGCKGNEIWVYDALGDTGTWSRFLIQAQSLRKIEFGNKIYMSVIRPSGVYYLDPAYSLDDYVGEGLVVDARPIDWRFETNTQGANRAHDAWAHLQQVVIGLGNFLGSLRFGLRGWDVNGRPVDISKTTQDAGAPSEDGLPWDLEDYLRIARDMKEWQLYGESLPGVASSGQVSLVQYRYAPVSVNVGYEYGSVETFEYTRNVVRGNDAIATNGVPVPAIDTRRP